MNSYAQMLAKARFYGAKSQAIDSVEVVETVALNQLRAEILKVQRAGQHDLYQVVLDEEGEDVLAAHGPEVIAALRAGRLGQVHGEIPAPDSEVVPISGEQSNTSLMTGSIMLKVFRKLEPGLNPDVELLSQIPECEHIAPVRGWVTRQINGKTYTMAMAQDLVKDASDGWQLALEYAASGKDFSAEAYQLGIAIRKVHEALASRFGLESKTVDFAQRINELATQSATIAEIAPRARSHVKSTAHQAIPVQRIHGDLHLGQVLRTPDGRYTLIDFEGEPARTLEQRRRPDSPLRDLAGMVRSLDYAASFGKGAPQGWAQQATAALLEGYGTASSQLLDSYILEKALYEVIYEENNRPDWVSIPLAAVDRIVI